MRMGNRLKSLSSGVSPSWQFFIPHLLDLFAVTFYSCIRTVKLDTFVALSHYRHMLSVLLYLFLVQTHCWLNYT